MISPFLAFGKSFTAPEKTQGCLFTRERSLPLLRINFLYSLIKNKDMTDEV
jgi:hypothetical protein